MKNLTMNRSVKWRMSQRKYEKTPVSINYDWRGLMDLKEGQSLKGLSTFPRFLSDWNALKVEDWCLNMIRQKYYVQLKDAKDYQRERWMPKVVPIFTYIMSREMVSLYDMSLFFGMPRSFLSNLAKRDENFRNWVVWLRYQNLERKADLADASRSVGHPSLLNTWKPEWNSQRDKTAKPYVNPIDVGWNGKKVSLKL